VSRIENWSRSLRLELRALRLAASDPRVPRRAKWLAAAVAYAVSPIDLIPDFIPVIGHLDDLIIVPALAWLALKQIDPKLLADLRGEVGNLGR
jgi:uncharacterized membrane protein YkvA (DUF1232 family)